MNRLTLKPIDKYNWEDAIDLSVKEEQRSFMASNLYSIAEVQFLDNFYAKGIYSDDQMVGFAMYGIDPDDNNYWIYRCMIDQEHQGKGFGTEGIQLVIEDIKKMNDTNIPCIMIGYQPENLGAKYAYKKAGFIETEVAPWGEQLAKFEL
ncbi:GNAT family N-acetyltransferase [Pseudoneobacillus sp. C159]